MPSVLQTASHLEGSIVPDIAIEGVLYDVKTVAATTEHYAPHHIEHYVKMEHKRGNAPVDRRARLVNGQYLKKAHNLDVKYNSVGGVECGPMENTIRNRGEVCGLAFGSAGEASADVHRLARVCADDSLRLRNAPRTRHDEEQVRAPWIAKCKYITPTTDASAASFSSDCTLSGAYAERTAGGTDPVRRDRVRAEGSGSPWNENVSPPGPRRRAFQL